MRVHEHLNYQLPKERDLNEDYYLTTRELAARWRCTEGHLANLRSRGQSVPFYRLGRSVVYAIPDIESWEAACRVEVAA